MRFQSWSLVTLAALSMSVHALTDLKIDWEAYKSPLVIPQVIDGTKGGTFEFQIGRASHNWTADGKFQGDIYGYGLKNATPTFPGPTIKTKKGVPISVRWYNELVAPHLLDTLVEKTLTVDESLCYPHCGVPAVVHVHGLESPARDDGLPTHTIYQNQSQLMTYRNNQSASTKLYHDHAMGLTRLNVWAGLAGAYIIEDKELDKSLNLDYDVDVPLLFADRLIDNKGKNMYSDVNCKPTITNWVPESYGTVNIVNGVVMPYYDVPNAQVRLRWSNIANTRNYNFSIPFSSRCTIIARDSGLVQNTVPVPSYLNLYPFQRVEMVCDFSNENNGTTFDLIDIPTVDQDIPYDPRIMQFRINSNLKSSSMVPKVIPSQLVKLKDLKQLFNELGGKKRSITLGEIEYSAACPLKGLIRYRNEVINASTPMATLACTRGKVEKWHFKNPTDDPHPKGAFYRGNSVKKKGKRSRVMNQVRGSITWGELMLCFMTTSHSSSIDVSWSIPPVFGTIDPLTPTTPMKPDKKAFSSLSKQELIHEVYSLQQEHQQLEKRIWEDTCQLQQRAQWIQSEWMHKVQDLVILNEELQMTNRNQGNELKQLDARTTCK